MISANRIYGTAFRARGRIVSPVYMQINFTTFYIMYELGSNVRSYVRGRVAPSKHGSEGANKLLIGSGSLGGVIKRGFHKARKDSPEDDKCRNRLCDMTEVYFLRHSYGLKGMLTYFSSAPAKVVTCAYIIFFCCR